MISRQTVAIPEMALVGLDGDGQLIVGMRPKDVGAVSASTSCRRDGRSSARCTRTTSLDVAGARVDPYTNRVVGAEVGRTSVRVVRRRSCASTKRSSPRRFRGESPRIVSWSQIARASIVSTEGADRAPAFYLYDSEGGEGVADRDHEQALDRAKLARARPLQLRRARRRPDPVAILTRPLGAEGPDAVDPAAARRPRRARRRRLRLAGARPGVARVRGPATELPRLGRPRQAWEEAGHGEWGIGVMQHDLTDGVAALVAAGIADPERVCIVGASYGGYAAFAGAAFTPELYRCAAAIAGVADLRDMLSFERDRAGIAARPCRIGGRRWASTRRARRPSSSRPPRRRNTWSACARPCC